MKDKKFLSLIFVALISLTGCNKKCSKEEFIELANKTSEHTYKSASVTCKGKTEIKNGGLTTSYTADDTLKFTFSNGYWNYSGDADSLSTIQQSLAASCIVLIEKNAKSFATDEAFESMDSKDLTFYSSPLGFRYNTKSVDINMSESSSFSIRINGPTDSTYLFDKDSGVITKYTEKSDLETTVTYDETTSSSRTKTDMLMVFKYFSRNLRSKNHR